MVTKGLNKITQNETQDPQLVDNFCKSWVTDGSKALNGAISDIETNIKDSNDQVVKLMNMVAEFKV